MLSFTADAERCRADVIYCIYYDFHHFSGLLSPFTLVLCSKAIILTRKALLCEFRVPRNGPNGGIRKQIQNKLNFHCYILLVFIIPTLTSRRRERI